MRRPVTLGPTRDEGGRSENLFVWVVVGVLLVSALIAKAADLEMSVAETIVAVFVGAGFVVPMATVGHLVDRRLP